jgi:hypothetical protein
MKTNSILLYLLISIALYTSSINCTKQSVRPNMGDIKSLIIPQIKEDYHPLEVESLSEPIRGNDDYLMTNAEIIGNQGNYRPGLVEKPIMYDTVITPHSTSISHSGENQPKTFQVSPGTLALFNQRTELKQLSKGEMALPVKIQMNANLVSDPTLANYETPSFLHLKQSPAEKLQYPEPIQLPKVPMLTPNIQAVSQSDIKKIKETLKKTRNLKEKMTALRLEEKRLRNDAKGITNKVEEYVNELLKSKEISSKLNKLLEQYTLKMKKDELKKLRLADRVEIKNELKQKLFKEIQGFRIKGDQFKEVDKVDKSDILKIVNQIKKKLGY